MDEKAWQLHESLQVVLHWQATGNDTSVSQDQQQVDHTGFLLEEHAISGVTSRPAKEGWQPPSRSHVRRFLRQLHVALTSALDALATEPTALDSELGESGLSSHPSRPDLPSNLRADLFGVLTNIDLCELSILEEDYTLHDLYQSICQKAQDCLVNYVMSESFVEPHEAVLVLNRITAFFLRENPFPISCSGELECMCILFSFLNQALFDRSLIPPDTIEGDCDWSVESNDCEHTLLASTKTFMEDAMGGRVQTLQLLKLFLPWVMFFLEGNIQPQPKIQGHLMMFVHLLVQQAIQEIQLRRFSTLRDYFQATALAPLYQDESLVEDLANGIVELVQSYVSELLEYTFDALDIGTVHFAMLPALCSHNDQTTDTKISHILLETSKCTLFSLSALRLMECFLPEPDELSKRNSSARCLWISYAKFFFGVPNLKVEEWKTGFTTEVFIKVGVLASTFTMESSKKGTNMKPIVLDQELQQALSITFLAALEFPEMLLLLENGALLEVIQEAAIWHSEFRHLVQGVALRGLYMPVSGAARHRLAMEEVLQALIQVGLAGACTEEVTEDDPWDSFFRDQIAMHNEAHSQVNTDRHIEALEVIMGFPADE